MTRRIVSGVMAAAIVVAALFWEHHWLVFSAGNACTLTLLADTNLSATTTSWVGTGCTSAIPGTGDTAIVTGAFKLTADQAWTIGADSSTPAVDLQVGAQLIVGANIAVTLRAAGLKLSATNTGWEVLAGGTLTCQSETVVCNINHSGNALQTGKYAKLTGNSTPSFAIITFTTVGAAARGSILGTSGAGGAANCVGPETFTISYGEVLNLNTMASATRIAGINFDHALWNNFGGLQFGCDADLIFSVTNSDFRNPTLTNGNVIFLRNISAPAVQVRTVSHTTFQGLSTNSNIPAYDFGTRNITFDQIVTDNAVVQMDSASNWTISNFVAAGMRPAAWLSNGTGFIGLGPNRNAALSNIIMIPFPVVDLLINPDGVNLHMINEGQTTNGSTTGNTITNLFADCWNRAQQGDVVVNTGTIDVSKVLSINACGNLGNGFGNPAGTGGILTKNATLDGTATSQNWPAVVIAERCPTATKTRSILDVFFSNIPVGIGQNNNPFIAATTSGCSVATKIFVPQSGMTLDYSGVSGLTGTNNYTVSANVGYLGAPNTYPRNLTCPVTAATNASPIVVTCANTFSNGQSVWLEGVLGNTAANLLHTISSVSGSGFTLDGSTGNGNYTSGGVAAVVSTIATVSGGGGSNQVITTADGVWPSGTIAGDSMCAAPSPNANSGIGITATSGFDANSIFIQATKCVPIVSVDSTTQVTNGVQLGSGTVKGISGAAPGDVIWVWPQWLSSGVQYGASGFGLHDLYGNPQYADPTGNTETWGRMLGCAGTTQQVAQCVTDGFLGMNGWSNAATPVRITPDLNFTIRNLLDYAFQRRTPKNRAYWCAGSDGESIGARQFCALGKTMIGSMLLGQ